MKRKDRKSNEVCEKDEESSERIRSGIEKGIGGDKTTSR